MPPGQALDALFAVRCRAEEKRRLEALAEAAGLPLTQWARRTLLAAADRLEGRAGGAKGRGKGSGRA